MSDTEVIEGLEELSAIIMMANHLAVKLPPAVVRDIEEGARPCDLWRLGASMAALALDTREDLHHVIGRALQIVRERSTDVERSRTRALQVVT